MREEILILVGAAIRDIRKNKGLSQEELGERANRHFSYIGKLERGESNITLVNLQRISNALGVGLHQFFPFSLSDESLTEKDRYINEVTTLLRNTNLDQIKKAKNIVEQLLK